MFEEVNVMEKQCLRMRENLGKLYREREIEKQIVVQLRIMQQDFPLKDRIGFCCRLANLYIEAGEVEKAQQ